jgi:hypothetical protein
MEEVTFIRVRFCQLLHRCLAGQTGDIRVFSTDDLISNAVLLSRSLELYLAESHHRLNLIWVAHITADLAQ